MPHLHNRQIILIVCGLLIVYLLAQLFAHKTEVAYLNLQKRITSPQKIAQTSAKPTPLISPNTASAAASPNITPAAQPHCLDEQQLTQILGSNYQLQNESFFAESQLLECRYSADQTINNLSPTLSYLLRVNNSEAENLWKTQQTNDQSRSDYRRIEDDQNLFADLNPVKEISQVTFYGFRPQTFLEVDYTPVKTEVGVELNQGEKVTQNILNNIK